MEWTESEEKAFEALQTEGLYNRMEAIQLYKRCRRDLKKAMKIAKQHAIPVRDGRRLAAQMAKKRVQKTS